MLLTHSSWHNLPEINVYAVVALHIQISGQITDNVPPSPKGSDFDVGLGWGEFSHSFQVFLTWLYALLQYMIGQIVNLIAEKFTLTRLEFQVMFSKAFEHNVQASQMSLLSFGKDNHVIQVN